MNRFQINQTLLLKNNTVKNLIISVETAIYMDIINIDLLIYAFMIVYR